MLRREDVVKLIKDHAPELAEFGISSLALFGSVARNESSESSDIDILVEFAGRARFIPFMGLRAYLEDLLRARIDLATMEMIRPEIRESVARDLIRVA